APAAPPDAKATPRQPLARALISAPGWAELPEALHREVADELNVAALSSLAGAGEVVQLGGKPNFRGVGKRLGGANWSSSASSPTSGCSASASARAPRPSPTRSPVPPPPPWSRRCEPAAH